MTENPIFDAQVYEEGRDYGDYNEKEHCDVCGADDGERRHYNFGGVNVCPECLIRAFSEDYIPWEVLQDMAEEYEVRNE